MELRCGQLRCLLYPVPAAGLRKESISLSLSVSPAQPSPAQQPSSAATVGPAHSPLDRVPQFLILICIDTVMNIHIAFRAAGAYQSSNYIGGNQVVVQNPNVIVSQREEGPG